MRQGEVWKLNLDPTVGAEMRKARPVIIVSDDAAGRLPLKVVVPITGWNEVYRNVPWMVKLNPSNANGLKKSSAADCFQLRSVSDTRFVKRLGQVDIVAMTAIRAAMASVLSMR